MRTKLIALAALFAAALAFPRAAEAGDWSVRVRIGGHSHAEHAHVEPVRVEPAHRRHVRRERRRTRRVHAEHAGIHRVAVRPGPRYRVARRAPVVQRGYWEIRRVKVWVPGYHKEVVRPPVYERRFDRATCTWIDVMVTPRRVCRVWVPGYHEFQRRRVWVPAPRSCSV